MSVRIVRRPKPATREPVADRVAVPGGAACPSCAAVMQRYKRPEGYTPTASPSGLVTKQHGSSGE